MKFVVLGLLSAMSIACGTGVYDHSISVVPAPPQTQLTVSVFDHYSGYSHEWAHKVVGVAEVSKPYRATITTFPTVTWTSRDIARPVTISLAIPDVSDEGYFLLTVDKELQDAEVVATF